VKFAIYRCRGYLLLGALVFALTASGARAEISPANSEAGRILDITVLGEWNRSNLLSAHLREAGAGPVIVLPVYTRCTMSCSTYTRKLEQEVARMGKEAAYRVLVISFDPTEDAESMRAFREREHVPAQWLVVRGEEAEIRRFFDFFHYSIMTEGGVLIHPSEIFLLDHELNWRATLTGTDWNASDLQKWLSRIEAPGISGWLAMNPEKLAWVGFGGLVLGLALTLSWLIWRKSPRQPAAA
jgi:cytochrome oxidase Cu insertion factor (SCO1/SenC/PrrC family)